MGQRTKKQHYISQFLLRRFASEDEKLWVYDKSKSYAFRSTVRDVACENYFNDVRLDDVDISFEDRLTFVESHAAPVIKKIVDSESIASLTANERAAIIAFIATQIARGKRPRVSIAQAWNALSEKLGGEENALRLGIPRPDIELDKLMILKSLPEYIRDFGKPLSKKLWMLQKSRQEMLLGDECIVLANDFPDDSGWSNLGLECRGIKIYLPLSPSLVLALLCPSIEPVVRLGGQSGSLSACFEADRFLNALEGDSPLLLTPGNVQRLNSLQIAYAHRFIFSRTNNFRLAEEMIQRNPKYAKIPQYIS